MGIKEFEILLNQSAVEEEDELNHTGVAEGGNGIEYSGLHGDLSNRKKGMSTKMKIQFMKAQMKSSRYVMSNLIEGSMNNQDLDDDNMEETSQFTAKGGFTNGETYFAPNAKLNETAMVEYHLKKNNDQRRNMAASPEKGQNEDK